MLTTLTFAFLLRRGDGVTLGLTSHDRPLVVDGVECRASPGMTPSAIQRSTRLDADTADLAGALSHEAIGADDLDLGRWTGAALTLHAVDWETGTGTVVATLIRGTLGAVERAGARFSVALDGPLARLDEPLTERTSPECRARLGDRRCRVDPARITAVRTVVAVDEGGLILAEDEEERWAGGECVPLDGELAGLRLALGRVAAGRLTLRLPPPRALATPVRVRLRQGCDKTLATCAGRYANAANFRGEPHLPGNDALLRSGKG